MIISSVNNYTFTSNAADGQFSLVYATISLIGLFSMYEVLQFTRNPFEYVKDTSNYFELTAFGMVLSGSYFRITDGFETELSSSLVAVGTLMLYSDILFYMRPFKSTGNKHSTFSY